MIDLTAAHFRDIPGVGVPDKAVARPRRDRREVEVVGCNRAGASIVRRSTLHDKSGVEIGLAPH